MPGFGLIPAQRGAKGHIMMTTLDRCIELLDYARVCYAHTRHSVAYTALEVAFAEHISPHKLAKTVVYASAQGYGLAVLPGDKVIDFETLGGYLNDPEIRLATEHEMKQLFPECEVGAMPPLGNLFHVPVIVDTGVAEQEFIAFNGGTHRDVVHMTYSDFARLVSPAVGKFAITAPELVAV
jgi:Ala-tRNA(Pro) deacylase